MLKTFCYEIKNYLEEGLGDDDGLRLRILTSDRGWVSTSVALLHFRGSLSDIFKK